MLDKENTINQLQSATTRAAIVQVVIGVLTLITAFTGVIFDIESIKAAMEMWLPIATGILTTWYGVKGYKGRIAAESKVVAQPWKTAVKSILEKGVK